MNKILIYAGSMFLGAAIIVLAVKCTADTNKVEAPTTLPVSDTADLKTDGPLSHFRLWGKVEPRQVLIKRVDTIVTIEVSNTYMSVYSFDKGAWRTNAPLPSSIEPVVLSVTTNTVDVPIK